MSLIKKHKSNIIFGSFAIILFAFFFSPLWNNLYTYLISLSLEAPNLEENLMEKENLYIDDQWTFYNTDDSIISIQNIDKPIFINFFATWCNPCKSEFPSIVQLYDRFKKNIEFIIVSPNEDINTIKRFEDYNDYHLPFFSSKGNLPTDIEINSYPTTIVIDKNKKVILEIKGAHDWSSNNVADFLNKLIKE